MFILNKGERADAMWGLHRVYLTDKDIEELKKGKRLYFQVFNEYAVIISYKRSGKK